LYYSDDIPAKPIENCPKFVLPSPEKLVAKRVEELAGRVPALHLVGVNMGGGFTRALNNATKAGVRVSAHPEAALALSDQPAWLASYGITVTERRPPEASVVPLGDFDPGFWRSLLAVAGLSYPDLIVAAVQDHGHHPQGGNRPGRFKIWKQLLAEFQGRPELLVYADPPEYLTRLRCLQRCTGDGLVADTGAAAALSVLYDPELAKAQRERGICLVNVGNSHTLGFLLFQDRIWGVYEQHTGILDAPQLWEDLTAFKRGELSNESVLERRGHGCLCLERPAEAGDFSPTYVIGPRRGFLTGFDCAFPAPGGDVMLAGCFGLLEGYRRRMA
jgi:uncharacterized protein (DUF1786 family)